MLPAAYINYTPQIQGLLFLGLLLGTLFAEVFLGGSLSDWLCAKIARRNNGIRLPEARLWLIYPAGLLSSIGLIIWGISIDKAYHWMVGQVAFFLFAAGIQMGKSLILVSKTKTYFGRQYRGLRIYCRLLSVAEHVYHNLLCCVLEFISFCGPCKFKFRAINFY